MSPFETKHKHNLFGNIKTQFIVYVGSMQILFKPRVCGKQLSAAFRKPADSPVESETPLFT